MTGNFDQTISFVGAGLAPPVEGAARGAPTGLTSIRLGDVIRV